MLLILAVQTILALTPSGSVILPRAADTSFAAGLPAEVRERLRTSREELDARRDTWERQTSAERRQSLDSLRAVADQRREAALSRLSPEERARIERRLEELDRRAQSKAKLGKGVDFRP